MRPGTLIGTLGKGSSRKLAQSVGCPFVAKVHAPRCSIKIGLFERALMADWAEQECNRRPLFHSLWAICLGHLLHLSHVACRAGVLHVDDDLQISGSCLVPTASRNWTFS